MDKITLYTTHCPKCVVLEKKLNQKQIEFDICDDIEIMEQKGFMTAPMLEVNNDIMDFGKAVEWTNNK